MSESEKRIERVEAFRLKLLSKDADRREWLNQNVDAVRREVIEAGCFVTVTISPPPMFGGLVHQGVDPFSMMFENLWGRSMVPTICDMLDRTIGVLRNPPPQMPPEQQAARVTEIRSDYAFVAMAMTKDDHQLVDVLEAIKEGAKTCGIHAERIDDQQSNERITDRILESIRKAEFVIVDLTHERPNVFYEAGYAHALGKTPVYLSRTGTSIHFDIKDFPVIEFRNMKELKEGLIKRLQALPRRQT
jgi:nucleoside 2-deoxyribosyltransferase